MPSAGIPPSYLTSLAIFCKSLIDISDVQTNSFIVGTIGKSNCFPKLIRSSYPKYD